MRGMVSTNAAKPPAVYFGLIALLAAIAFFLMLGRTDIVVSHEARVAQTARMMAATGWPWNNAGINIPAVEFFHSLDKKKYFRPALDKPPIHVNPWFVPTLDNRIRLQKPPLPYWLAAALYRFIDYSEFPSRL